MNIGKAIKTSAKTEIGKFRRDLNLPHFKRSLVPSNMLDLYDWCKSLDTKQVNYLLELKNLSLVLKTAMLPAMIDKIARGEIPDKKEIDALRLLKDVLSESHKLKYGDRKVIEKIVTYDDVRKQIFSEKKIINAKVIEEPEKDAN